MGRNIAWRLLRGILANLPALTEGEPYYATDTKQFFIGTTATPVLVGPVGVKQIEIDFGPLPVSEKSFTIADTSVLSSSKIVGAIAYAAPTGKDLDEIEMDNISLTFGVGIGQFTIFARGLEGYVADKFKVNYMVG